MLKRLIVTGILLCGAGCERPMAGQAADANTIGAAVDHAEDEANQARPTNGDKEKL